MTPEQTMTIQALQTQLRELGVVITQLESARDRLLLPAPASWLGTARHAYDAALDGMVMTAEAGLAAVRSARMHTERAIGWMQHG